MPNLKGIMVMKMPNKKKNRNANKEKSQKKDLNYRKSIEIIQTDQREAQIIQEYYEQVLKEMNKEINANMERYIEAQHQLIELKLQENMSMESLNRSVQEIFEQYNGILEMYERINSKV